jgi:hypothetical protein
MKISKISWVFLMIGVVLIAAISLGMTHSSQSDQQRQLQDKLDAANKALTAVDVDGLTATREKLAQDAAMYAGQIDAAKGKLDANWDDVGAIRAALAVAATLSVDVLSVNSSGAGQAELAGAPCATLSLDFGIQGTYISLRDFVSGLTQTYPSGIVKLVQLDSQVNQSDTEPQPEKNVRGSVHLVIYNYGGK